jgi:alanyl-tRNA synthetase
MALFGEKYGERVRVLSIKVSKASFRESCAAAHTCARPAISACSRSRSDESIASGVRRIRAITGVDAYERFRESEVLVDELASGLRTSRSDLAATVIAASGRVERKRVARRRICG